ncbi:hypothetical protein [Maribacter sp.]|uniref:hypothetical protein n=1 Tax=Maribacter sp. TaxID=1897614 RepID=UPI0025C00102|nr:hypothetical protein [Maribacter sp.]
MVHLSFSEEYVLEDYYARLRPIEIKETTKLLQISEELDSFSRKGRRKTKPNKVYWS